MSERQAGGQTAGRRLMSCLAGPSASAPSSGMRPLMRGVPSPSVGASARRSASSMRCCVPGRGERIADVSWSLFARAQRPTQTPAAPCGRRAKQIAAKQMEAAARFQSGRKIRTGRGCGGGGAITAAIKGAAEALGLARRVSRPPSAIIFARKSWLASIRRRRRAPSGGSSSACARLVAAVVSSGAL
jgi:hypothetical protein